MQALRITSRSRADAGWALLGALSPIGRAQLAEAKRDGVRAVVYTVGVADEALAERLVASSASGIFGFVDAGRDGSTIWLARVVPDRTLADALRARREPWPWRDAVAIGLRLAEALRASEKQALFPGSLAPEAVRLDDGERPVLPAEDLLAARLGATGATGASRNATVAPLWTPPAQLDGAPWDAAANLWCLGMFLYRAIAGEHPFAGGGLRHALAEASHREAPPFADAIAQTLPAGLQSLVLKLLDADPARRPASAKQVHATLETLAASGGATAPAQLERARRRGASPRVEVLEAGGERGREPGRGRERGRERGEERERERERPDQGVARDGRAAGATARIEKRGKLGRLAALVPIGLGALIGALALGLARGDGDGGKATPRGSSSVRAATWVKPLGTNDTTAQDCASCHPRQAAEWRRSVMAHSVKSPLFGALESFIEEQAGRDVDCPNGAGILRKTDNVNACRDPRTGVAISGSGGEHWCVNCHSPSENLEPRVPVWQGKAGGDPSSRLPVRDLLGERGIEGISCGSCHTVHGPVGRSGSGGYEGNATWTSFVTGRTFAARPEDGRGVFGIANSGALMLPGAFVPGRISADAPGDPSPPRVHARPDRETKAYLATSEFCGACHDVRLFGTDVVGGQKGEHFKRLRNAYSEWDAWARDEKRAGRSPATCQDCHMSQFPGVCVPAGPGAPRDEDGCPPGTKFESKPPGSRATGLAATSSARELPVSPHYFSGVDTPLSREYPDDLVAEAALDAFGTPISPRIRREQLLKATFKFDLAAPRRTAQSLEVPIEITNIGAGHRVPAGFSQEREFWVHLKVTGQGGRVVYEVGNVTRNDQDLGDKIFLRVNTDPDRLDFKGRPEGLFGADVRDGPDHPRWSPDPIDGGRDFRGDGLINLQNGFLRCVRCVGTIDASGRCQPGPGQGVHRADRFDEGDYDPDTGECRSNLVGKNALYETYFPVGALDASRGFPKAPDAIIDTRSAPPNVPLRFTYVLPARGVPGPYRVEARLLFRAFPPFLVRAFAEYERIQASRGKRPSGPMVDAGMFARLDIVEIERLEATIP
jgi:hypothetical protein